MDRREFLKVTGTGALTLFLSGCGINAVSSDKKAGAAASPEAKPGGVSKGKKLKIVVLCGSPHKAGTSALLADKFIEGAQAAGHEVFRFNAAFEDIHPCNGCDACGMSGPCVINDAISQKLMQKLVDCDMVALVTPLYYYGFSAQIKMVIDRFYSQTGAIHRKKSMLMATAWNSSGITFNALQEHYDTLVRYMEWQDVGRVLGYGCGSRSAIEGTEFPEQAFNIGKKL